MDLKVAENKGWRIRETIVENRRNKNGCNTEYVDKKKYQRI